MILIYVTRLRDLATPVIPTMLEFSKFIFELRLMDIPLVGGKFTWSNNHDPLSWCKILDFFSLLIVKPSFQMSLKGGSLGSYWITSLCFLIVVLLLGVVGSLSLRIYMAKVRGFCETGEAVVKVLQLSR